MKKDGASSRGISASCKAFSVTAATVVPATRRNRAAFMEKGMRNAIIRERLQVVRLERRTWAEEHDVQEHDVQEYDVQEYDVQEYKADREPRYGKRNGPRNGKFRVRSFCANR